MNSSLFSDNKVWFGIIVIFRINRNTYIAIIYFTGYLLNQEFF